MKTTTKNLYLAIMIALFTSTTLFAFEDSVKVNDHQSISLVVYEISTETHITLKDSKDHILYEQRIEPSQQFAKAFNLELLPKGAYSIVIEDGIRTKVIPVSFTNEGINLLIAEKNSYFKPVVNKRGTKIHITQFTPGCEPLHVAIYNSYNELVYEDLLKGKMDLGKIYDFSESRPGNYRIALKSESFRSAYDVNIR